MSVIDCGIPNCIQFIDLMTNLRVGIQKAKTKTISESEKKLETIKVKYNKGMSCALKTRPAHLGHINGQFQTVFHFQMDMLKHSAGGPFNYFLVLHGQEQNLHYD